METKDAKEKSHASQMNKDAVERVKREAEAANSEQVFFEDDAEVKLRDGRVYRVPPASLKNARKLMKLLKTINVDIIILNFVPTEDAAVDAQRENDLFDTLLTAFSGYPHVTRDYLDEYVDLELARKIIDILIGLNGLKK